MAEDGRQKFIYSVSTMALLKVVLIGLLLFVLYEIRGIILLLLISMVLASAMDPLVDWLYRKAKFPRGLSVILVYLVFIGLIVGVIYFLIPPLIAQFNQLGGRLNEFRHELQGRSTVFAEVFNQLGLNQGLGDLAQNFVNLDSGSLFRTTVGVVSRIIDVTTVLAISFYLISSENGMKNLVKSLVPLKHKAYAVSLTHKVQAKIGRWLLGQFILSLFIFGFTYIGLTLLGVKYALALSLLAGLLEIVPYLGPILSAIPAIFIAFVQSPPLALFILVLYIVIQQTENYVLVPKIMGKTMGANPIVILVALLVGFQLAGIMGMLLAVPIVAAVQVFLSDVKDSTEELV